MGYSDIKELLKDARDIATGANNLQLAGLLIDIQGKVYDLQEENRVLREENHELKNQRITEDQLTKVGSFWKIAGKEYLYCPRCWGKDNKLVVCNDIKQTSAFTLEICPVCGFNATKKKIN